MPMPRMPYKHFRLNAIDFLVADPQLGIGRMKKTFGGVFVKVRGENSVDPLTIDVLDLLRAKTDAGNGAEILSISAPTLFIATDDMRNPVL